MYQSIWKETVEQQENNCYVMYIKSKNNENTKNESQKYVDKIKFGKKDSEK